MSKQAERHQGPRLPGWWSLVRDVLSFLGGWALIFMEVQREDIRESVLILAAGVVGIPTAAVGIETVVGMVARRNGTGDSSSSPPEEAPSESRL